MAPSLPRVGGRCQTPAMTFANIGTLGTKPGKRDELVALLTRPGPELCGGRLPPLRGGGVRDRARLGLRGRAVDHGRGAPRFAHPRVGAGGDRGGPAAAVGGRWAARDSRWSAPRCALGGCRGRGASPRRTHFMAASERRRAARRSARSRSPRSAGSSGLRTRPPVRSRAACRAASPCRWRRSAGATCRPGGTRRD